MTTSDCIAIITLFVAFLSLYLSFRTAKLQTETFLMELLAGKSTEANTFNDLAESHPETIHYQNALAALVQATQIYDLISQKYEFFIWKSPRKKFMSVFFLHWRTNLQNKIFEKTNVFENILILGKTENEKKVILNHIHRIREYVQSSRDEYSE